MARTRTVFRGKKVLVVGLGLHGGAESAIRWLHQAGAKIRVTDTKSAADLQSTLKRLRRLPLSLHLGGHRLADVGWADMIYQNQSVPTSAPIIRKTRQHKKKIVNEVTIFFEHCPARIIGVTGTRGKSTTTALVGEILKAQNPATFVSGNIRETPMLTLLPKLKATDTVVLELSSFHLEFLPIVQRSPSAALITNLKVDHLNRYRTLATYAQAKYQIVRWQQPGDLAILNADIPLVRKAKTKTQATVRWFSPSGKRPGAYTISGTKVIKKHGSAYRKVASIKNWKLPGRHQQENVLAAVTLAHELHVPTKTIERALSRFSNLPHRQELIRRWKGHAIINDTTATTPDGTLAALDVYPNGLFILGGTDKQLAYQELAMRLSKRHQPIVFLPGDATERLLDLLHRYGWSARHIVSRSMASAVRHAAEFAKPKQPIVLSPGAASFGLFQHEFDRGQQFIRAVNRLP